MTEKSSEKIADDASEGVADEGENIDGPVVTCLQHGRSYSLRVAASVGAVAAPDFAVHDRRLQGLLGAMIGGGNGRIYQKEKPKGNPEMSRPRV